MIDPLLFLLLSLLLLSIAIMLLRPIWQNLQRISIKMLVALLVVWSIALTLEEFWIKLGVITYNEEYILGYFFGSLPMEEVLFLLVFELIFLSIYVRSLPSALTRFFERYQKPFIWFMLLTALVLMVSFSSRLFFMFHAIGLSLILAVHLVRKNTLWMPKFLAAYSLNLVVIFIAFALLSGTFTAEPIKIIQSEFSIPVKLAFVPIDWLFYHTLFSFILIWLFERGNKPEVWEIDSV